jgi:hypothetical protein
VSENPAAFPCTGEGFQSEQYTQKGMTLRDWFAGQALGEAISIGRAGWGRETPVDGFYESAAGLAYKFADAMLTERERRS